jgi:hypothetical protein
MIMLTFSSIGLANRRRRTYDDGVATTATTDANWRYMYAAMAQSMYRRINFSYSETIANSRTVGWSSDHDVASVWNNTTDPHLLYGRL